MLNWRRSNEKRKPPADRGYADRVNRFSACFDNTDFPEEHNALRDRLSNDSYAQPPIETEAKLAKPPQKQAFEKLHDQIKLEQYHSNDASVA